MDHMKEIPSTNRFIFNFKKVSENFIQIGLLGTDIQNFGKLHLILYNIILFESMTYIKKVLLQNSFIFLFYV